MIAKIFPHSCSSAALASTAGGVRGQQAEAEGRRVADLRRRPRQHALLAARSDHQRQLQQARSRVAVQDRRARPAARVQLPGDAADGRRRRLLDRRHAPRRRRARRRHRRDAVDAQRERRQARRSGAAPALGPRPRLLDRRPRATRIVYVTPGYQMVALDAKTGVPVAGFGKNGIVDLKTDDDQPIDLDHRRDRPARGADRRQGRHRRRRRAPAGRRAEEQDEREGLHPRLRRAHRQAAVDLPHHSARRASSATTPGRRTRGRTPATPACGRR